MQKNRAPFITLITVFFFWGFVAASNDILIPVFKEKLNLEQWQSQLISVAFYLAYTVGSVIYLLLSRFYGGDILNKLGYKNGIALGLTISAFGTLLFYPAAEMVSFGLMITVYCCPWFFLAANGGQSFGHCHGGCLKRLTAFEFSRRHQ